MPLESDPRHAGKPPSRSRDLRRFERIAHEQADLCRLEDARVAFRIMAGNYREAARAIELADLWTQFWTQTIHNGIELAGLSWTEQGGEAAEKPTQTDGMARDGTVPFVFQDRCLKPLGHPSEAGMSVA
jgi:hypothetical protein